VKLLWTKSDLVLSKGIRYIFREDSSHFAFIFDDDNRLVFHSNLIGAHVMWSEKFLSQCEVVFSIDLKISQQDQDDIYEKLPKLQNSNYDFGAFLYLGWRGILKFIFNIPLPNTNAWAKKDAYLCTEMASLFRKYLKDPNVDLGMTTPDKLYKMFKAEA
jgi:hypothetical protein